MTCARPFLAVLLALAPASVAMAEQPRAPAPFGASSGASAAQEPASNDALSAPQQLSPPLPKSLGPAPVKRAPQAQKSPSSLPVGARPANAAPGNVTTGSVVDRVPRPLASISTLHIEVLPLQGDAEKCGLEASALQTSAVYPVAASARLKVGRGTLTHMHIRLSAVYVRRLEHCILNADVRVSSLQQVELQHSKVGMPVYVPLWEKSDVRLVPRAQAQKLAQERLKQISEQLLIDWAGQN